MIINFLGDSITQGSGASCEQNMYVNLVGKALGATVRNYGVSGTRIANNFKKNDYDEYFALRGQKMENDADYVFVFGGTNDFGHGDAPIGTIDDTTDLSFYGALKNLINLLLSKYDKKKIVFILPLRRSDEDNPRGSRKPQDVGVLSVYVDIMKQVLESFGIAYMDTFYNSVLPTPPEGQSYFFTDGLHPNDAGHAVLAQMVVGYIQRMEFEKK
jgi:lysophospholipase L1-like esterase